MNTRLLGLTLSLALLPACVTQKEHERVVAEWAQRLQDAQSFAAKQQAEAQAKVQTLQQQIQALEAQMQQRDTALSEAAVNASSLQAKLDDVTAINGQLTAELERLGKNVSQLLSEKGSLSQSLENAKTRLEELRKAQAAANQRAQLFKDLLLKFKKMIDGGELKILLRDGRMVLQLRNDVLFDSGMVTIKPDGQTALKQVAGVLATLGDRKFQVAGHTDNVPISTARFPSNWELSTARAVSVVKFLTAEGVSAEVLSAAGYSEYDPVTPNESKESKAKNRRIEIVLQPNIAELVSVPID